MKDPVCSEELFSASIRLIKRLVGIRKLGLVGGFNPSELILVSWDDYSQNMEQ